ncbi:MAG: cation:proton antiporter [Rhizobacter sp.]|nr:cation:proton antiporter [Bacteriovorax sp.]
MKLILFYCMTIVIGVGIFLGINLYGLGHFGQEVMTATAHGPSHMSALGDVLLALVIVVIVARACGFLFKKIGQPTVMGEVIGGILLGPSLCGRMAPGLMAILIPPSTLPYLNIIAQIGIVIYMFLVGLELDLKELKKSAHTTFIISHASILVPFLLGSILALYIYQEMAPPAVSFTNFALFLGVSMSITAFPVLARILADKGMTKTKIGSLALTCAAIDDVTAWCLLALVVSRVQSTMNNAYMTYALAAVFILIMIFVIKPFLEKWVPTLSDLKKFSAEKVAFFLVGILISALITETIGIHAIFGAFLFGVIIPNNSFVSHDLDYKLQEIVRVLFLPAFFAYTGMKTQIGLMDTAHDWILCLVIIAVATLGKFGGTVISAKLLKHPWRESLILGILMNTRGLVELIALNIGLELGILSPRLFTMLVIMAVVTTFMTGPVLSFLEKKTAEV